MAIVSIWFSSFEWINFRKDWMGSVGNGGGKASASDPKFLKLDMWRFVQRSYGAVNTTVETCTGMNDLI